MYFYSAVCFISLMSATSAGPATESYKDQFCTDPRTMQKHAAYTEWADAYSCTRHRCQPGGRNLAIYTVGCKRVEAPESAIECEEVVEDTNMQFPFCCTRLRCLVVVRGEVWTRVLGQPWEALPAAPWSHMYKMKKPPPPSGMLPKNSAAGPVYQLAQEPAEVQKVLRASKPAEDCNDPKPPLPDIVIALATESDNKEPKKTEPRHKRRKPAAHMPEDEAREQLRNDLDLEDAVILTERADASEEKSPRAYDAVTRKASKAHHQAAWTEIPQKEWNEQETASDVENGLKQEPGHAEGSEEKRPALQALVDAIGSRMRDIENVVQRMSEKVQHAGDASQERRASDAEAASRQHLEPADHKGLSAKPKQPGPDTDHYKRFSIRNRGSKYLRATDGHADGRPDGRTDVPHAGSEPPLFVEDAQLNGYFSDASNSVLRRSNPPKEPAQYVAAVEAHRSHILRDASEEARKTRKKHTHKKKARTHKKTNHGKDKHRKRPSSAELDRTPVSLEDASAILNS